MGWDPIAVVEGGVISYVRADHIGRPVFATNATGAKVWTASYLPFGGVRTTTGIPITARFPGQWFQTETGLHQNWMRDYDPTTGRYIQADPLGLVDGASVYGYALQNPGRFTDPTGEFVPALIWGLRIASAIYIAAELYCADTWEERAWIALENAFNPGRKLCPICKRFGDGKPGKGNGNPFEGKSPSEIDEMFRRKGFDPRGPDPVSGKGGYVNPKTGRSYHIDPANSYGEPPHVDVNRPRDYRGPLPKKKFPL